jgi:hypothetical protein
VELKNGFVSEADARRCQLSPYCVEKVEEQYSVVAIVLEKFWQSKNLDDFLLD